MTDGELLRQYATENSEAAFRDLVARQVDLVYSAALRQTNGRRHLAEDVSQLVFTELARQAPRLVRHPSLRGWLFLCTRHIAARTLRAECRRLVRETAAQAMNELPSGSASDWENIRPVLDEVLFRLKDRDREALFLRFFDKFSFADLGARFGLSEDAARRRVDRALDRIRSLLAKRGITSTAAALGAVLTTETVKAAPHELVAGIAQAALSAVSTAPSTVFATLSLMKSIALSTTFIALVALTGILAGGAGLCASSRLERDEASARADARAIPSAEARLARIKQQLTQSGPAGRAVRSGAKTSTAPLSLEDQIARDLELNRWKEQQKLADAILRYGTFFKQHGMTPGQMEQLVAVVRKTTENLDDLGEVARLAGVQIQSDPELLAQAQQLLAQHVASLTAILGADTVKAFDAYAVSLQNPSENHLQTGEARWVADQVAGVAFAEGSPITADQKAQMTQLLLKYTPNYQPGEDNSYSTLNWNGILSEAQQTAPAPELAALQSYHSASVVWTLQNQARKAAAGATMP